jgi:hypothetical protein
MFPTGPNPRRSAPPPFSLDHMDIARAKLQRRKLSRTEWRMVLFLPILLGLMVWTMWDWKDRIAAAMAGAIEQLPATATLAPMVRPDWEVLPVLPDAASIAAARPDAEALVQAGVGVPLTATGLDAITLAWAEVRLEADRLTPPLPQRLVARDLLLADRLRLGTPLILEGRIEDRLAGNVAGSDRPWQRLLLAIDEGQFVEVLSVARSAVDIPIGTAVRVTGRLLTYDERTVGATSIQLPVALGRVIVEAAAPSDERDAMAEFHRPFSMPEDVFSEVDDLRLWTETKPYYHLLGQVLRDQTTAGAWDGAPDGNQAADDIHMRPADFRGKPFRITGFVYEAWEDHEVARDQPFGVGRVVRMLLWRRDLAPVTESVNGVEKRAVKAVLRLYEFAAITDQKPPPRGTLVTTHGRFLKKRAIPVKVDERRDQANGVQRQSDRVYTWMFVTGPWSDVEVEQATQMGPLGWISSGIALVLLLVGVVWWRREVSDAARQRREQGAAARAAARANRKRAAGTAGDPPSAASPDTAGGQNSTPL